MRKNCIIKMENKLNKHDIGIMLQNNSNQSYLVSGYLFSSDGSSKHLTI